MCFQHVTGLVCPTCRTEVRGEFQTNEFALLPPEHLEFLRLYIIPFPLESFTIGRSQR